MIIYGVKGKVFRGVKVFVELFEFSLLLQNKYLYIFISIER